MSISRPFFRIMAEGFKLIGTDDNIEDAVVWISTNEFDSLMTGLLSLELISGKASIRT
jgi:hypothetical protein